MTNYIITGIQTTLPTATLNGLDSLTIGTGAGLYIPGLSITATPTTTQAALTILGDLVAQTIDLGGSDIITIGPSGSFVATTGIFAVDFTNAGYSQLLNLGTITASFSIAVVKMQTGDTAANHGTILGNIGVSMGENALVGSGNRLINTGTINTQNTTVEVLCGNNTIENSGLLRSNAGNTLQISGDYDPINFGYVPTVQTVVNDGVIAATYGTAVQSDLGSVDSYLNVLNTGTISGLYYAIRDIGSSSDYVRNQGRISGVVSLGFGDDYLDGRNGTLNGDLYMGYGSDVIDLRGAQMTGTVYGGEGADTYFLSDATTLIVEEGADIDLVNATTTYRLTTGLENLTLLGTGTTNGFGNEQANVIIGNIGDNRLMGLEGNDTLLGDLGNDRILGGNATDSIDGGDGDDTVLGGAGTDTVRGGDGDDRIDGGAGKDFLAGNLGADLFVFTALAHSGNLTTSADIISDFVKGDDRIDLSVLDANANNAASNDTFVFIGTAAFSNVAGQLRVAQSGGNTYVELDVDGNSVADAMVRLTGLYTLNAADFVL